MGSSRNLADGVVQSGFSSISFSLSDFTLTALPSTALPPSLNFASFAQRKGSVFDAASGGILSFSIDANESLLTALSPAKLWVGLKNSDAVGLRLDLIAEVFIDSESNAPIGTGYTDPPCWWSKVQGPLSLVNRTSVRRSSPDERSSFRISPTLQSSSSITSP